MSQRERMRARQTAPDAGDASAQSAAAPPSIDLRVEQLVVDGLPASDRDRFGNALQAELERLLAERGMAPAADLDIGQLMAGNMSQAAPIRPEFFGRQVAEAIHRQIGQVGQVGASGDSSASVPGSGNQGGTRP